ncbi:hypothetical protein [Winogradskyella sp. A2]|uniref:hypothetical protein n=1 Tax=Winogradskyella sp. A2 TaxID=3366944 RepID=UPI00398C2CE6
MELFIGYTLFSVLGFTIYLIRKEYLIKQDLLFAREKLHNKKELKHRLQNIGFYQFEELDEKNQFIHPSTLMLKSLRHLDFMSQLEEYLDSSGNTSLKAKYHQEFMQNKIETQQTVLKSAELLSKGLNIAA